MSRLTKKDISDSYDFVYPNGEFVRGIMPNEKVNGDIYINGLNKLGELEDIEDELGCSLETLFNALKNGIDMDGNGTLLKPRLYYDDVYKQWKFKVYYTPTACGFYNVKDWLKEDLSE